MPPRFEIKILDLFPIPGRHPREGAERSESGAGAVQGFVPGPAEADPGAVRDAADAGTHQQADGDRQRDAGIQGEESNIPMGFFCNFIFLVYFVRTCFGLF